MDSNSIENGRQQVVLRREFEISYQRNTHFSPMDFHSHDFYEFYLFLDGGVTYYVEDQIYDLMPGDMLIIPPGRMHRPAVREGGVYERIVFEVDSDYLRAVEQTPGEILPCLHAFYRQNGYRITLAGKDLVFYTELFKRMAASPDNRGFQKSLANVFIQSLPPQLSSPGKEPETRTDLIPGVIRYLNAHFREPLTLDDLCSRFFVSKYHLLRQFKNYTSSTIHDYILAKRIVYARQLIRKGFSASDACAQCGFSDYSNFYRVFIAKTGMTPAQFKARCNESHT